MSKSKSSHRWKSEHERDEFVRRARAEGYRSRASYKLIEMADKYSLLAPGMTVVDLGAAPGGWSQVAAKRVGPGGKVLALDLLPMDPIDGVTFIQGDFVEDETLRQLAEAIGSDTVDLVLSDMAPNMTGVDSIDQPSSMYLVELALDFAINNLSKNGSFLVKVFQGEGFDAFLKAMRDNFIKVVTRKPSASRSRSREVYLLGRGLK